MDLLYPYQIDEPATKVLEQYVLKVRRKIVGTGMKINTVWGRGFQLIYLG